MSLVPVKSALSAEHSRRRLAECAAMHGHSAEGPPVDRKTSTTFRSAVSFVPPEPNGRLGRSPCLLRRAANGADDRGRERCPRPIGCCAFGRRLSAVMSGAGASDIPDAAGSVTCLVLSQARRLSCLRAMPVESRHRPILLTTEARFSSETRTQSSILGVCRPVTSCRQNSPMLLRVSRLRFTTSAHRMTGQSVDPRLVFLSVKKSLPLGHGCDRLAYPEAALLKIVSK